MSTEFPTEVVNVHDQHPHFQPIRLSAESLVALHRETIATLEVFVANHRSKFPVGPVGSPTLRRS